MINWILLIAWIIVGIILNMKDILSWIIYIVVSYVLSSWLDKVIVSRQMCPHGVRGGLTRWKCSLCCKERDDAEAEARRIKEEAEKKEQQRKKDEQEAHDRWKRKYFAEIAHNKETLDNLSAEEFEQIILTAYSRLGYKAEATSSSGDKGIDGYLYKDGLKIGLQCKKQAGKVTDPAMRNFLGSLVNAGCSSGIFATSSDFTYVAVETAKANNIKLVNRDDVMALLVATINDEFVSEGGEIIKFQGQVKICPRCHSQMYVKYSRFRKRSFWGCSKYPECKYAERY